MSPSLPYTVVQTRDRGKCVIAARDIEAGELVLEDRPLLVTPLIKSKPQCLQCARSGIILSNSYEFPKLVSNLLIFEGGFLQFLRKLPQIN